MSDGFLGVREPVGLEDFVGGGDQIVTESCYSTFDI
jgi:hypothetical protein